MARVTIIHKRTGVPKEVPVKYARILVGGGRYAYPVPVAARPIPARPEPRGLTELSYNELRKLATEHGVTPEGRTKDDYLQALLYRRRDMRAE